MTVKQLGKYIQLKNKKSLLELKFDKTILKSKPPNDTVNNGSIISDPVAEITEQRDKILKQINSCERQMLAIEHYIERCDEYYGEMLKLHYIGGKSWTCIAMKMGGGNTKDSVKKACHRYVEKNP